MISTLKPTLASLRRFNHGLPRLPAGFLRGLLPIVLLAVGITALVLMFAWRDQASYKPVFGGRENVAVSDMISVLDAQGVAYRLHPETGQVLVPEDRLGQVRMLLASKGVTARLPAGLELMDRNDPLGVTQFVQDVRFRRGLEGELTQSIMTLDAVQSARVHLSIAKSSSFVVSDGEKSSASVVLVLKLGQVLGPEQIAAVINLVANSVATLDPARVSVVDQAGNFLSSRVDLSSGFDGAQITDSSRRYQNEARQNIDELLAPIVGRDNFKASITVDVDNDRVQESVERFGEAPRITNEAMRVESGSNPLALGVPGSLSNRPLNVTTEPGTEPATAQKNATTRQYAYDRSITQVQRSRGRLKRLNVAVVLNEAAAPGGKGWTPAALQNIENTLRGGLGIDGERGDQLVVSTMAFPARPAALPWWQQQDNVITMGSWLAYALAILLAYLLVFRPILKLARQNLPGARHEREIRDLPAGQDTDAGPLLPEPSRVPDALPLAAAAGGAAMPVVPLLENYDLPPPGSPVDVMVDHLRVLSAKEPERVAEVVRQWVQKNG